MPEAAPTVFLEQLVHLQEHPEAGIVPEMPEADFRDLVEDIRTRGIVEPLHVLFGREEGVVLDGRHRLRAARELGLERVPVTDVELRGQTPVGYMLLAAVRRRHLTDDQRAMLAEEIRQRLSAEAKEQRAASGARARKVVSLSGDVPEKQEPDTHPCEECGAPVEGPAEMVYCGPCLGRQIVSAGVVAPGGLATAAEPSRKNPRRDTRREAAEAVGLPAESRKLRQAQQVAAADPELAQEVKAGRKTLREAAREVRAREEAAAPTPAAEPDEEELLRRDRWLVETYRITFGRLAYRDDTDATAVWTIGRWKVRVAEEIHRLLGLVDEAARLLEEGNTRVAPWMQEARTEFLRAAEQLHDSAEEAQRTTDAPHPVTAEEALRDALRQGLSKEPAIRAACWRLNYESGRRDWHPYNDFEAGGAWADLERRGVVQKVGGRWKLVEEPQPDPQAAARAKTEDELRALGLLPAAAGAEGGGARG